MRSDMGLTPRETWRQQVGGLQSRNSMVCKGAQLFVGTCGDSWNERDRHDGVFCLDCNNGSVLWFTPTTADVNEICLAGSNLLVPTDAGDVFVLDAATGSIRAVHRADSPVFGAPIVTEGVGGWAAIFASSAGTIYLLEEHSKDLMALGAVGGGIRASLVKLSASEFVAGTLNGKLVKASIRGRQLTTHEIASVPPDDEFGDEVTLSATPLLAGRHAFAGFARSTTGNDPAVFCVDVVEERVEWVARSHDRNGPSFGNVRTTPTLVGSKLIVASAYTEGVDILDAASGAFLERVTLGQTVFQQWSSPVPAGGSRVALGRVDGVCSIVDVETSTLVASISLATAETERLALANRDQGFSGDNFALYPGEPAPEGGICGTPLVSDGMLFVGTTDGVVAGVRLDTRSTYH